MQMSFEIFGCNFKDLVKIDQEVFTCETQQQNWDAPIEALLSDLMPDKCSVSVCNDNSDDNESESAVPIPTYSEACDLMNRLKLFAFNSGYSTMVDSISRFDEEFC